MGGPFCSAQKLLVKLNGHINHNGRSRLIFNRTNFRLLSIFWKKLWRAAPFWDRSLWTHISLKTKKFSIAFEYPEGMIGGNFQTWNLRFYNFYKQYVLFHPKTPKVDGDNAQKHVIVLENMDFDSTPKFHLFDRIVTQHSCFSNEASGRSVTDWFVPTRRFNKKEDVSKVRVDRIQGWVLPRN